MKEGEGEWEWGKEKRDGERKEEGRTLKRMKAGSKGRVNPIMKRSSHITIVVSEKN